MPTGRSHGLTLMQPGTVSSDHVSRMSKMNTASCPVSAKVVIAAVRTRPRHGLTRESPATISSEFGAITATTVPAWRHVAHAAMVAQSQPVQDATPVSLITANIVEAELVHVHATRVALKLPALDACSSEAQGPLSKSAQATGSMVTSVVFAANVACAPGVSRAVVVESA